MRSYSPRRASKRWLSGAPAGLLDLFRCGKKSGHFHCEAFYVPTEENTGPHGLWIGGREMDADPSHPQGVGMSFEMSAYEVRSYRYRNAHKRITWQSLPEKVKTCILRDLGEVTP